MLTKKPTLQNQWYENISNHMFFGYKYCGQFIFNLYILLIETSFPANVNGFSTWKLLSFIRYASKMRIMIHIYHIFDIYPQWMACSSSCKRIQSWPDFVNVKEKWWGERGEPKKSFLDAKSHSCHPGKKKKNASLKGKSWQHQMPFLFCLTPLPLADGLVVVSPPTLVMATRF